MKVFLSKEHYCYKIHTSSMKSIANPHFYRQTLLYGLLPHFYKKILIPPSLIFQKSQPPINKEGSHYVVINISLHFYQAMEGLSCHKSLFR